MSTSPKTIASKQSIHTPGPWQVCRYAGEIHICGPNGNDDPTIATVIKPGALLQPGETPVERAEANARVLAAAPKLLVELREALTWCETYARLAGGGSILAASIAKSRAAIAEAEGRT